MRQSARVSLVVILAAAACLTAGAVPRAWAEGPRDRAEKNAVRGMTGEFDGVAMVLWVSRDEARRLLPNPDLQLDYPDDADRHPVVLLLGSEHDVGVQLRRTYVHPRFLRQYENAYVIVPYLRHPAAAGLVYTFSKIFVSDERVTEKGVKLNHSPKVHAAIQDAADRFVVNYEGERRIDLTMQENPPAEKLQALVAGTRACAHAPATPDLLRTIFRQPKIEFSPNVHLFAFDFMAEASGLTSAIVSGTVRVPAVGSGQSRSGSVGDQSSDVLLLSPDRPVEAIRFSVALEEDAPILSVAPGRSDYEVTTTCRPRKSSMSRAIRRSKGEIKATGVIKKDSRPLYFVRYFVLFYPTGGPLQSASKVGEVRVLNAKSQRHKGAKKAGIVL